MRLSHKLSMAQFCLLGSILLAYAVFQFAREMRIFEADMIRDHHVTGVMLRAAVVDLWSQGGADQAAKLIADAGASNSGIEVGWVPLAPEGVIPGDTDAALLPVAETWEEPLRRDQELVRVETDRDAAAVRATYVPVRVGDTVVGALRISEPLAEERRFARATILHIVITTTVIAGGGLLLSLFFGSRGVVRPIEILVEQARRIGAGDLSPFPPFRGHDEVSELAREMNQMAVQLEEGRSRLVTESNARIAALEQLRHADRLATVGTLASGLAHELGTPLNVVNARARLIETGAAEPEEIADNARIIHEQGDRMIRIIRQLLDLSRKSGDSQKQEVDLREPVRSIATMLGPYAGKRRVTIEVEEAPPELPAVCIDREGMTQVLANLVMNGIQAMPKGGVVRIRLARQDRGPVTEVGDREGPIVALEVIDEGTGIAPESIPRIFDPFYTTKAVGEGTGLGLSVSYGIIREFGGWIEVSSEPGAGSVFRVCLPCEVTSCAARS
jgi:two-component system, NtrC family, sensor kinase